VNAVAAWSDRTSPRWSSGSPPKYSVAATSSRPAGVALHVAMLAPPWISVPPPGYGGVESVVDALTEALVRRGNSVTLFCAPGSVSSAHVVTLLEESHPDEIERSLYEVDHVARAFEEIDLASYDRRFDVIHDHCGFTALAMADRVDTPLDLHPGRTDAEVEVPGGVGHVALRVQRD
jgi:glycosyltransferase involved in cell wall biosynthesis